MLEELEIRSLGPIHNARLTPATGMTAITGETGAGKSMLLSAIRLISGGSADSGRVSADAQEAWAQGVFTVADDSAAADTACDAGADVQDGELFLSRTVPTSGRSRAVLNGKTVPRTVLQQIADGLVTVHGQSDQLRIALPARQREFLDMVANDQSERDAYRNAWEALRTMDERLNRLQNQEASIRQRADYLRDGIERINRVDPKPGEDDELATRRARIENAAEITQGVSGALAALDSSATGEPGASDLITRAAQSLRSIHVDGVYGELADRLDGVNADLLDVMFTLSREVDDESTVEDLDAINERIHELNELTRRWGPTLADVIVWRDKAVFDVEDLDASPEKLTELQHEREQLFQQALDAANTLSAVRQQAAVKLSRRVSEELNSLAMVGAHLTIRVEPRSAGNMQKTHSTRRKTTDSLHRLGTAAGEQQSTWPLDAHGCDDIEFLFAPFPESSGLPMGKSASGGELSRLMLALELVAAEQRSGNTVSVSATPMTFIFDEVDSGVGGKAAVELGKRLAQLARDAQVIVVTHLAQVASWADTQYVVSKDGTATTGVHEVRDEERVREIARMLSGSESDASLDHARELLADSHL